jgi:hypothetical protein
MSPRGRVGPGCNSPGLLSRPLVRDSHPIPLMSRDRCFSRLFLRLCYQAPIPCDQTSTPRALYRIGHSKERWTGDRCALSEVVQTDVCSCRSDRGAVHAAVVAFVARDQQNRMRIAIREHSYPGDLSTTVDKALSLAKILSGVNSFEISESRKKKQRNPYPGDQNVAMLHRVENR